MSFQGNRCVDCDLTYFPPRAICRNCGQTNVIHCEVQAVSVIAKTEVLRGPGVSHDSPVGFILRRLSNGSTAIERN